MRRPHSERHAFYVKLGDFLFLLCFSGPLIEQSGFLEQKGVGALFRPGPASSVVLWSASAPALSSSPVSSPPPLLTSLPEPVLWFGFHSEGWGSLEACEEPSSTMEPWV